jgi:hypothetical protein
VEWDDPLMRTDDTTSASTAREIVTIRSTRGVSHEKFFVDSQARVPDAAERRGLLRSFVTSASLPLPRESGSEPLGQNRHRHLEREAAPLFRELSLNRLPAVPAAPSACRVDSAEQEAEQPQHHEHD